MTQTESPVFVVRQHVRHWHVTAACTEDDQVPTLGRCDGSWVFSKRYLADAVAALLTRGVPAARLQDAESADIMTLHRQCTS